MPRIDAFLQLGREQGCSDIHFTVGLPPLIRLDGQLIPIKYRALTLEETTSFLDELLDEGRRAALKERGSVDFSYSSGEVGRFRINVCAHLNGLSAVCRAVPGRVPRLADLGLPKVIHRFTRLSSGSSARFLLSMAANGTLSIVLNWMSSSVTMRELQSRMPAKISS